MLRVRRSWLLRYGFAVLAVVLVLLLKLLLAPLLEVESPFLLFFAAVMVSTWYGGRGPGLLTIALATLISDYFFISPFYSLSGHNLGQSVRLGLFVLEGVLISWLVAALHTAKRRAEISTLESQRHLETLRHSEARFGSIAQSNLIGIFFADLSGNITKANDTFLETVGYTQEDLLAGRLHWSDMTPPEYLPQDQQAIAELRESGVCTPFEKEYIRKDGSRIPILLGAAFLKESQYDCVCFALDITERKQTEQERVQLLARERAALAESEAAREQVSKILESITDGFIAFDREWRFTYLNHEGALAAGRPSEDLLGKNVWEEFPELVDTSFGRLYQRAVAEGVPLELEDYYPPFNAWFAVRAYPSETGLSLYFRDVTDRKQAEEALRKREDELRLITNAVPVLISFVDSEQRYRFNNQAYEEWFGYSAKEVYGKHLREVLGESAYETIYPYVEAVLSGQQVTYESQIFYKDDAMRYISATYVPQLQKGKVEGFVALVSDISDRKQAEAALRESESRFRVMADTAPVLIWMSSLDKLCDYFNQSWLDFTGRTLEQELGSGWIEGIYPEDLQQFWQTYLTAFEAHQEFKMEFRLRRFDGEYRWVLDIGVPRFVADGSFVGYIGSAIDITERKQVEEEREQFLAREQAARTEAETANRMKDEFLATLSHELRTPLNAMLGWTQLLRTRKLDEVTYTRALETVDRNTRSLASLIEDVLDVSRIIRGQLRLNVRPVQLVSVIEAAIDAVRPAAEVKAIRLQMVLDPATGPVAGDSDRLQQIVWNLLSNAIKFTPKKGRVQVLLEQINSHVELTVSDTGKGIKAEFLPYVFERFRQADSTTTRTHSGLGLGLAIVRHLVELHGGTVHAESPGEGQGAIFIVKLPLMPIRLNSSDLERVHPRAGSGVPFENLPALNGLQVLVVDDEADAREFITTVLEQCGAAVTAIASAKEALEVIERSKLDVLISDIGMPEEDGYALINQVRSLTPEQGGRIPAAALTAYAREEDRTQALLAGFQLHVSKPVSPAELAAVVANLAGRTGKS